jgi:outer membrane protein OmpA-like peptidoglycan-associated protein
MSGFRLGVAGVVILTVGCSPAGPVRLRLQAPLEISAVAPQQATLPPPEPPPPAPPAAPEPPPPLAAPPPAPAKKVEVRGAEITISEKIQFELNTAKIKPVSRGLLDEIAETIKANPQIKKILVEGHASAEGAADKNQRLSADRANSVVAALVDRGVSSQVLTSSGAGSSKPIADNATAQGREQNRRVEFHILEQQR